MAPSSTPLDLRVGDLVEVRSEAEILRTLDSRGTLDSLPFMPEMLQFCGKRLRVYKSAHKACDTIDWGMQRRIENAVHLEGVRCDGGGHDGCGNGCLIYWKEAWLKRVTDSPGDSIRATSPDEVARDARSDSTCTRETLAASTRTKDEIGDVVFACQATELIRASVATIPWWALWQYVRDVRSGNAGVGSVLRGLAVGLFNRFQRANVRISPRLTLIQGGRTYPFVNGQLKGKTESGDLMLEPGELVEVKSKEAIFATLNEHDRTRGLRFDGEMLQYCGRRGRVDRRVERIIDEKTGRMLAITSDSILIEGFVCPGTYHRSCPRASPLWWRESWLERVDEQVEGEPAHLE